ncbi:MAG: hypothetical protein IBX57_00815 [Gammaproteobacteria bacterium]|nr:hypothetical protein [Gammaproteobacteria bacterium]
MSIVIANDGDRIVNTIADRNAIAKKFPGMQVTVKDATGDPQTGGGFAKYEWIEDGDLSRWGLIQVDNKISMKFATERHTIVNGQVTADNVPLDGKLWGIKVIDTTINVILGDIALSSVTIDTYDIILGTNEYDGKTLEFAYAYGAFSAQLDSVFYQLKDKHLDLAIGTEIDLRNGALFTKTITSNTSFTVTGVEVLSIVDSFILEVTNGGAYTITWFDNILWDSGKAPTLTEAGLDAVAFYTYDNGATWRGVMVGSDMKVAV